jgi:membrane protein
MTERRRRERAVNVAKAAGAAFRRLLRGSGDFITHLYEKAGQDDIFFLAGGIAYNVIFAAVPFLLMLIGVFGYVLPAIVDDPQRAAVDYVLNIIPPSEPVVRITRELVGEVLAGRGGFSVVGLLLFVWGSTRLFGTLRAALKDIFDLPEERGIVEGKIFDLQMVIVAGSLLVANTGITVAMEAAQAFGIELLGIDGTVGVRAAQAVWAQLLAFGFIFVMFLLIYRYLPKRRTPWRIALVAAAFASVAWELLKGLFALYVESVPSLGRTYGTLVAPVVLVLWIYYSCVVFILAGEIAQVYDLTRVRRAQRELLE